MLNELGVWRHEEYLRRKELRTHVDDVREVMPDCVLNVRYSGVARGGAFGA